MADLAALEERIRVLEDIEAIRKLKHRYLRCLDGKLFDEMGDLFTDDVRTSYFNGEIRTEGKAATLDFFKMGLIEDLVALHHGHHAEIEITGPTTATGIWGLYNYLIDKKHNRRQRVGGIYHETYVKENGRWKIRSITCRQLFQETWDQGDIPSTSVTYRGTPQSAATPDR